CAAPDAAQTIQDITSGDYRLRIAKLRSIVRSEPRNALRWADLAWVFTALGVTRSAGRAMRVALALNPENRFILRAAVRFEIHRNDIERASEILRADRTRLADPWILAAEIATSTLREQTSPFMRLARQTLDSRSLSSWHLSELASAVATVE